jgi:hypothetical protein
MAKRKRKAFLEVLSQTGQVTKAAQAVGYTSTNTLHRLRREDEDFAEEWDLAVEVATGNLEAEAIRRAYEGVMEPTYYKGEIVGYHPNYSDQLLQFVLRKLDPSFRDTNNGGGMNINFGVAILTMTAKSDEDWEARAVEMHGNQTLVEVEAKVEENELIKVTRGD